jgi:hypothetical protein
MKLVFLGLFLFSMSQVVSNAQSNNEPNYLLSITVSSERPTPEQVLQQRVKTNPKLKDINGNEKFIYWDGLRTKPSTNNETAEVRRAISEEIKSIYKDFYLSQTIGNFAAIQFNVLIKKNASEPASTSLLKDWLPEKDLRVKQSKQALLTAVANVASQIKRTDKENIVALLVDNAGQVSSMAAYEFTGLCGNVVSANLRRKDKSMEVDFDFSVNSDGTVRLLKKTLLIGDSEVAEAFDKWIEGCVFNADYFAGKIFSSQRVKVEFK